MSGPVDTVRVLVAGAVRRVRPAEGLRLLNQGASLPVDLSVAEARALLAIAEKREITAADRLRQDGLLLPETSHGYEREPAGIRRWR